MGQPEPYRGRIERFQELMREAGVDASMIRTLSSFAYFTGVKWLRPALLVPAEGEPIAFAFEDEAPELKEQTGIEDVRTWRRAEELMRAVSGAIRDGGFKVVGFDYSLERDAYVLFFELFKKLNRQVEVGDVHGLIMKLRMIKDRREITLIERASETCAKGMEAAVEAVEPGATELEVAAEAYYVLMKSGARHPLVYVNAGPSIRIHAEPLPDVHVREGYPVVIVVAADQGGYYADMTRTVFVGKPKEGAEEALRAFLEAHSLAEEGLRPRVKLIEVQKAIEAHFREKGYEKHFVLGFAHGVGLLVEEDPITTIVAAHRQYTVERGMVLASVHSPITIPGLGAIKVEDTYVIEEDRARRLTAYDYELFK